MKPNQDWWKWTAAGLCSLLIGTFSWAAGANSGPTLTESDVQVIVDKELAPDLKEINRKLDEIAINQARIEERLLQLLPPVAP